ncbi:hypothetical protein JTB14_030751 [Gonioctena quinquepunctata]|nr:hypothetical protein JTB14_030751 [Gonioctena quinquepunctata]
MPLCLNKCVFERRAEKSTDIFYSLPPVHFPRVRILAEYETEIIQVSVTKTNKEFDASCNKSDLLVFIETDMYPEEWRNNYKK